MDLAGPSLGLCVAVAVVGLVLDLDFFLDAIPCSWLSKLSFVSELVSISSRIGGCDKPRISFWYRLFSMEISSVSRLSSSSV